MSSVPTAKLLLLFQLILSFLLFFFPLLPLLLPLVIFLQLLSSFLGKLLPMILPSLLNIFSLLFLLPAPTASHAPYLPAIFALPVSVPPTLHVSPASPASLGQMRTTSY